VFDPLSFVNNELKNSAPALAHLGCQTEARFDSFCAAGNSGRDVFTYDRPMFETVA
jgi:hypothetical protein